MTKNKELKLEELSKAAGGSTLFSDSLEEARTKFIHEVSEQVVCVSDGERFDGVITKLGIGCKSYGDCSHRYDNYYYCEIEKNPTRNGWYMSWVNTCSFGPKTDAEIGLVEEK